MRTIMMMTTMTTMGKTLENPMEIMRRDDENGLREHDDVTSDADDDEDDDV